MHVAMGAGDTREKSPLSIRGSRRREHLPSVDGAPDALRCRRHLDVLHTIIGQRVDDRVDDNAEGRRRAALAGRAHAERVRRRRHFADLRREERKVVCPWH